MFLFGPFTKDQAQVLDQVQRSSGGTPAQTEYAAALLQSIQDDDTFYVEGLRNVFG